VTRVQRGEVAPDRGVLTEALFRKLAHPTLNIGAKPRYFSGVDPNVFENTMMAARQGVVYDVPGDLTEKMAPKAGPITSKAAGS
jgi:hypothetical protein